MSDKGRILQNSIANEGLITTEQPVTIAGMTFRIRTSIGAFHGTIPAVTPIGPILVLMRKVIPAIVTGCSVVIKPSEETTLLTLRLAELFRASTIPAGLIQIVPGTGETVGTQLASHKDIQLISLTGSMRAGKSVYENAAQTVKALFIRAVTI
jgi:lactaldehyde dehydrogenase/glycolaldehyde dehydrogenase